MAECDLCGETMKTPHPLIWYLMGSNPPFDTAIGKTRHICEDCLEKCVELHKKLKRGGR